MNKLVPLGRSRPISKVLRLHGTIARDIGSAVMSGKYQPGDLLTGEIASSERLEVSRTAYREAVRILAAKGLVNQNRKSAPKYARETNGTCSIRMCWPGHSRRNPIWTC